jgi:DNA-binding winged helix-turn-helix (wHTH) protein
VHVRYVFADCELDTALYVLHRHGRIIRLRPKVFRVLLYLLEHRDEVVSKHDLMEAVWPDQYISDATLADVIRAIRQSVGDDARRPHVIRTRHGHGYHFAAEVTVVAASSCEAQSLEVLALDAPTAHGDMLPGSSSYTAGERQVVTVLSGSLGRGAALLARLGLDALHSLMHGRYDLVQGIVQQYGGTLQPLLGDRMLAVFGVAMAHEDHARRAALAALAIRNGLQVHSHTDALGYREALAVRFGMHTGQVAVEVMEPLPELTAMLIGDVLALAIVLQEHAEPGTILCSDTTARLLQHGADLEPHVPIAISERSESAITYTLRAARDVFPSGRWTRPLRPFVGR